MVDGVAAAGLEFCGPAAGRRAETPFGAGSSAPRETGSAARAREYEPIEMPKNSATGFVNAFFAVVIGFALIWHIWWMAGLGAARRIRDAACLRVPRRGGSRDTGRADCPVRSRSPGGGCAMNIAVAIDDVRHEALPSCQRGRSRSKADRRRLRLLDLPPQRHRDVLGAVCGLRGARACDCGRSDRRRSCSIKSASRSRPLVFLPRATHAG